MTKKERLQLKEAIHEYEYTMNKLHLFGNSGLKIVNIRRYIKADLVRANVTLHIDDDIKVYHDCEYPYTFLVEMGEMK